MIYLDNNATTPVDPEVLDAMLPFLRADFANPSSGYSAARPVRRAIATARDEVAGLLGCDPEEVVFTSGGTEAANTALFSATRLFPGRRHLVIGSTEHDAVHHYAAWLERDGGYEVTALPVDAGGVIPVDAIAGAIRPDETAVVAVMAANNETGVIGPVAEAAAVCAAHGVCFVTDAVQAAGKIPLSLRDAGIHCAAISGHKLHAPKGTGALYVNRRSPFQPWVLGGSQESARRAGTENVAGIVGLGAAAAIARRRLDAHPEPADDPVRGMRDRFEAEVVRRIPGVAIHGVDSPRVPNTSSLRIAGVEAQALIVLLDQRGVCVSAGSACATGDLRPSRVLTAMGISPDDARSALRFSFSRFNSPEHVDAALDALDASVARFREVSG